MHISNYVELLRGRQCHSFLLLQKSSKRGSTLTHQRKRHIYGGIWMPGYYCSETWARWHCCPLVISAVTRRSWSYRMGIPSQPPLIPWYLLFLLHARTSIRDLASTPLPKGCRIPFVRLLTGYSGHFTPVFTCCMPKYKQWTPVQEDQSPTPLLPP